MKWTAKLEPDGYWYVYDDNDEGNSFFETKDADRARLIGAAPQMLTALKVAKANLQPLGDSPALDIICSAIERGEQRS